MTPIQMTPMTCQPGQVRRGMAMTPTDLPFRRLAWIGRRTGHRLRWCPDVYQVPRQPSLSSGLLTVKTRRPPASSRRICGDFRGRAPRWPETDERGTAITPYEAYPWAETDGTGATGGTDPGDGTDPGELSGDPLSDATMVARARDGDTHAFETLVRRYQRPIYRLAVRMLYDTGEAEDV